MHGLVAPPDVLYWNPRSGDHGDCAVAAIELACGITYERALEVCLSVAPKLLSDGMLWGQIRRAAQKLGFRVKTLRPGNYDLDDDETTGILDLEGDQTEGHVVYVWAGRIIEPKFDRRSLWVDSGMFLKHYHYTAGSLLVFEETGRVKR